MRFGTMKGHLLLSVFLLLALSRNLDSFVFRPSVFAFRNAAISSSYRQRVAHSVRATPTGLVDDDESSVHLRLGEISATAITQTAVSQSELVIDEFVSCSDNITVVACVGNRTKLEILSKHLFGSNYSTNAGFRYNEVCVTTKRRMCNKLNRSMKIHTKLKLRRLGAGHCEQVRRCGIQAVQRALVSRTGADAEAELACALL